MRENKQINMKILRDLWRCSMMNNYNRLNRVFFFFSFVVEIIYDFEPNEFCSDTEHNNVFLVKFQLYVRKRSITLTAQFLD